ncbi:acyl-CoA N-acyltransferase [Cyathus striatus]|nr:acyl-CoA N-acyltransferase [Cyathus striatus]
MPATHVIPIPTDIRAYIVTRKDGQERPAHILDRRANEVYVHYIGLDKRLDEWISESDCRPASRQDSLEPHVAASGAEGTVNRKRKRGLTPTGHSPTPSTPYDLEGLHEDVVVMTEEDYDIQHHKQITAKRNFDWVHFGEWKIKTWYFSPYPLIETEIDEPGAANAPKIPGVARVTARSHGRTSDLLAGGLGRHGAGEKAMLWVCDFCFKYMAEPMSYEVHKKHCDLTHPPGKKVYQRGAHIIWEVDGAAHKLYCQNLALFGKLFIDVKTLFFDCDNFLFYILTDATSTADHMIGFFSKEKVSYDDYNLACIMTLPPYQRKGYGMLLIEFSYELSRRSGKVGTPERPLSDLGLRSYLAYWVATLIRFFRRVLSVLPPEQPYMSAIGNFPDLTRVRSPSGELEENGNSNGSGHTSVTPASTINGNNGISSVGPSKKRKSRAKGWDGEADPIGLGIIPASTLDDPLFTTQRSFDSISRPDGGAETHVSVRCTLADIARATNLRIEDTAFALNECGLLTRRLARRQDGNGNGKEREDTEEPSNGQFDGETMVVITRQRVEEVAQERRVKKTCIDLAHVLLPERVGPDS